MRSQYGVKVYILFLIQFKDKDVVDLEDLVSSHHVPAQQARLDQGEYFSNLEMELAALDETPAQSPPQQEQPEETVAVTAEPEESQNGNVVQPQKVI